MDGQEWDDQSEPGRKWQYLLKSPRNMAWEKSHGKLVSHQFDGLADLGFNHGSRVGKNAILQYVLTFARGLAQVLT